MKRLRLLKVIVQPVLVIDDGNDLSEFPNTPSEIPASEWPQFADQLLQDMADAEKQINAEPPEGDASAPANS